MSVYVIAEAGSNHDGDLARALDLVAAAAEAGANAVKFQAWNPDTMYVPGSAGHAGAVAHRLPIEWLPSLAAHAAASGIDFLCSVFDGETAAAVDPYVKMHKIASLELTWDSLLRCIAAKGKPILLSTGAATLEQIGWAVSTIREANPAAQLTLLHCVTAYPAPMSDMNLHAILTMSVKFQCKVGFSDHSTGTIAPVIAVALGAPVIEKHFTLDKSRWGPDHHYAQEPHELRAMIGLIRVAESALGDGTKRPMPSEAELRALQRGPKGLRGQ